MNPAKEQAGEQIVNLSDTDKRTLGYLLWEIIYGPYFFMVYDSEYDIYTCPCCRKYDTNLEDIPHPADCPYAEIRIFLKWGD